MAAANSEASIFCKVRDCRFSSEHVTAEHFCRICGCKGHGQIECTNLNTRNSLNVYHNEILPLKLRCTRPKCESNKLHTINGHLCEICLPMKVSFSSKQHSRFNCNYNPDYIARRTAETINSVSSSESKDILYKLTCPVCRTDNEYSDSHISSSIQEIKCCVCTDVNKKLIFLPSCKHFNLCTDCAEVIRVPNVNAGIRGLRSFGPDTNYNVLNDFALDHFKGKDGKLYMQLYAGMGWSWFVRRHRIGEIVEVILVDGQFDDNNMIERFINGYTKIDQIY